MPFSKAQQQAIDTRNKNILVSASAGSGKTSVLVERLCQLVLKDHISIDSILAMTFTEDAAAEMKTRLKLRLQNEEPNDYINKQLALLETASISTIDGFCYGIVQNYYYQIPISYTMSKTVGSKAQGNKAFQEAYNEALTHLDEKAYTKLKLFFHAYGKNEEDIQSQVNQLIETAKSKPDPIVWIQEQTKPNPNTLPWFLQYFRQQVQILIDICEEMIPVFDTFATKKSLLIKCLELLDQNDYATFKKQFEIYFTTTETFKKTIDKVSYASQQKEFKEAEEAIFSVLFDPTLFNQDLKHNQELIQTFASLSIDTMHLFAKKKEEMQFIDFSDMEHFAYRLLNQPMIQEEIRNKYEMILVDEFQDTNDLQENIIQCFCRGNNVFRVGDIKQSIYGFRQARPEIMKKHMESTNKDDCLIVLDENYRSNQSIIDFNNDFYSKIMCSSLLGDNFIQEDIANVGTCRQSQGTQYPVRFLYTAYLDWLSMQDEPYTKTQAKTLHKKNRMDLIAHDILKKHEEGLPFKDICILTRSHAPQEELKEVFEAYGIPVLAEIDHGFYTNHAIQIIVSWLSAIQNPHNDIALMSALCSPIGNVSYEQLATACQAKEKGQSLYTCIQDQAFMKDFNKLRSLRFETICDIVIALYTQNDFYFKYTTRQDKTNLDQFLDLAAKYPEPLDLTGFIDLVTKDAKQDSVGEAYPYGKNADVVKIKTMHHSKGLQFPLVYLLSSHETKDRDTNNPVLIDTDLGISFNGLDPDLKVKRPSLTHLAMATKKLHDELKEEMRVFYVATTRAEKELVIVDFIDSLDSYAIPFSTRALLSKKSYTGWLLHTYSQDPHSLLQLDKVNQLYERPKQTQRSNEDVEKQVYKKEVKAIANQTASKTKTSLEWPSFDLHKNISTKRGTLFHEIVANVKYPYQKEACIEYAKKYNYTLTQTDLDQLLSLNSCEAYREMMEAKHEFECSYIVKKGQTITHGFMDLVVWFNNRIYILDFKTDTVKEPEELIQRYKNQLKTYKDSLKAIESLPISTFIYTFHLKKLIIVSNETTL